ncbi:metal-sulfur cluster assembly factor [Persephonella sp.]|uniref:metal-sulfur cluster assembly factor n=1 Tax=Persephonella sp. TaxID=2060922 RepID=UPI002620B54E|nr:metal-sulfur cluster assembly factor [Persephonella sp.]
MTVEIDVLNSLKEVYDPEIPLNIVDLGLVKGIHVKDNNLEVVMTLTTPKCPLEKYIKNTIIRHLRKDFPQFEDISIQLDFSQPWTTKDISPEGLQRLRELGWNV